MGNGMEISFSDSLLKRLTGAPVPRPVTSASHNRRTSNFFPKTSESMLAMFEKAYSQKMADKMADNVVNLVLANRNQPTYYNYNIPHVSYYNYFLTNTEDVFAIEMQVCPECIMIEPTKILYTKDENSGGIRMHICSPRPAYVLESQRPQYQLVIAEDWLRHLLKKWLDCITPTSKNRRIIAIPIPQLSPGNSRCAVRLSVNGPASDPTMKKYVTIQYLKEKCYDLLVPSNTESNHWSSRVLQNESTTFADDDEVTDYLSCTKHSSYGFFRIKMKEPFNHSMRIPSGSIYLIMLLVDNNLTPAIDSVFDILDIM
jgi:hypothetical protein